MIRGFFRIARVVVLAWRKVRTVDLFLPVLFVSATVFCVWMTRVIIADGRRDVQVQAAACRMRLNAPGADTAAILADNCAYWLAEAEVPR